MAIASPEHHVPLTEANGQPTAFGSQCIHTLERELSQMDPTVRAQYLASQQALAGFARSRGLPESVAFLLHLPTLTSMVRQGMFNTCLTRESLGLSDPAPVLGARHVHALQVDAMKRLDPAEVVGPMEGEPMTLSAASAAALGLPGDGEGA